MNPPLSASQLNGLDPGWILEALSTLEATNCNHRRKRTWEETADTQDDSGMCIHAKKLKELLSLVQQPKIETVSAPCNTEGYQPSFKQESNLQMVPQTVTANKPSEGPAKPTAPYFYYKDYSTHPDPSPEKPLTLPGRIPSFPVKMHAILSRSDLSDIVCWLPHGRAWRVLKPREFEVKVIPTYFEHNKFSSFIRQANGWGFRRITAKGPDRNAYYHEQFLRGLPHLCKIMQRPAPNEKPISDPNTEPDFYKISEEWPVPDLSGSTKKDDKFETEAKTILAQCTIVQRGRTSEGRLITAEEERKIQSEGQQQTSACDDDQKPAAVTSSSMDQTTSGFSYNIIDLSSVEPTPIQALTRRAQNYPTMEAASASYPIQFQWQPASDNACFNGSPSAAVGHQVVETSTQLHALMGNFNWS